jgi:hypothetical protein
MAIGTSIELRAKLAVASEIDPRHFKGRTGDITALLPPSDKRKPDK